MSQKAVLPNIGSQIIAQYDEELIVVYQAYKPSIGDFASRQKRFGGNDFSFSRMSWIKPNFLWMMFRAGWATKENQESILAIWLRRQHFETILAQAVHSTFVEPIYKTEEAWKSALAQSDIRLQWDPDHDPYGNKIERRAMQLGLKGHLLKQFATDWIVDIQDITPFVSTQRELVKARQLQDLQVPVERIYCLIDNQLSKQIGIRNM